MPKFYVTQESRNVVEVEADSPEAAHILVEEAGSDEFESVHYEAWVVKVVSEAEGATPGLT